MRRFGKWALAGIGLALGLSMAVSGAQAETFTTCDGYATAAADTATKNEIQPAGDFEAAAPGKVLVFAAGQKFYLPQRQVDDRSLAPTSVWQRMRDWNSAYSDALWQCKHRNGSGDTISNIIVIQNN